MACHCNAAAASSSNRQCTSSRSLLQCSVCRRLVHAHHTALCGMTRCATCRHPALMHHAVPRFGSTVLLGRAELGWVSRVSCAGPSLRSNWDPSSAAAQALPAPPHTPAASRTAHPRVVMGYTPVPSPCTPTTRGFPASSGATSTPLCSSLSSRGSAGIYMTLANCCQIPNAALLGRSLKPAVVQMLCCVGQQGCICIHRLHPTDSTRQHACASPALNTYAPLLAVGQGCVVHSTYAYIACPYTNRREASASNAPIAQVRTKSFAAGDGEKGVCVAKHALLD